VLKKLYLFLALDHVTVPPNFIEMIFMSLLASTANAKLLGPSWAPGCSSRLYIGNIENTGRAVKRTATLMLMVVMMVAMAHWASCRN
jgi:accessory gene regulator protein AgrB